LHGIRQANKDSEAGILPSTELLANMGKFNEELVKAGVMLAGEGLKPSSAGKRITSRRQTTITDGPFAEPKSSSPASGSAGPQHRRAVEWLKRSPFGPGAEVEIRPVFEAEDFGGQSHTRTQRARERLRNQIAAKK